LLANSLSSSLAHFAGHKSEEELLKMRFALVLAALVAVGAALTGTGALARSSASPVTITVTMSEFKFKLSRTSVPVGTPVTFKIVNKGASAHDFDFSGGKGTPYIAPKKTYTLKVTFGKKGTFRYVCTVPRHAELGMSGNFFVK
jgi:plastocyanin